MYSDWKDDRFTEWQLGGRRNLVWDTSTVWRYDTNRTIIHVSKKFSNPFNLFTLSLFHFLPLLSASLESNWRSRSMNYKRWTSATRKLRPCLKRYIAMVSFFVLFLGICFEVLRFLSDALLMLLTVSFYNCVECLRRLALDLWLAKARRPQLKSILKMKNIRVWKK